MEGEKFAGGTGLELIGDSQFTVSRPLTPLVSVQVPPYVEVGEKIRVDTRDGRFIERAKD